MPVVTDRELDEIAMHLRHAAAIVIGDEDGDAYEEIEAALNLMGTTLEEKE